MIALLMLLAASDAAPVITTDGIGPFTVGKPLSAIRRELHMNAPQGSNDTQACAEYPVIGSKDGVYAMIENGRLTRVTITIDILTASGVGVGSSEAQLRKTYGSRLKVTKQPYGDWPQDKTYYLWSSSGNGIRFDVSKGTVKTVYAGTKSIEYMEGCV